MLFSTACRSAMLDLSEVKCTRSTKHRQIKALRRLRVLSSISGAVEEPEKALPRTLCPLPSTAVSGSVELILTQDEKVNATQGELIASWCDACTFVSPRAEGPLSAASSCAMACYWMRL